MTSYINKNLKEFAEFDPSKDSKPMPVSEICKLISQNQLTLPIFQTSLRWNLEKNISLLNYLLLGKAAVSPISVNEIKDEACSVKQVTFITRDALNDSKGRFSVTDGQQRCSCCFLAYTNAEEFKNIVLDITEGEFIEIGSNIEELQIPVGILYNKDSGIFEDYIANHRALQEFTIYSLLMRIRTKFFGYYFTVNFAKDLIEDEQIKWFDVLNLAGSRVPLIQLELTKLLTQGIDFYTQYADKFVAELKTFGFNLMNITTTEVSIPLACLNPAYEIVKEKLHSSNYSPIPSDAKVKKICNLKKYEIEQCFDLALKALHQALIFVREKRIERYISRIDYVSYLLGLFVYLGDTHLNSSQEKAIINWIKTVQFNNASNSKRRLLFEELLKVKNISDIRIV